MQGIFYLAAIVAAIAMFIWFVRNADAKAADSGYKGLFAMRRPEEQVKPPQKRRPPWSRSDF
jgi:hypothetical protein